LQSGGSRDDGFHRCWGTLADPQPHLFSLYQLYSLKKPGNRLDLLADAKIAEGKTSLFDISQAELAGEHQHRQRLQLRCKKNGEEWIDPKLGEAIAALRWPVAFVDFETILMTMPWYAGLRPGQVLPFQFSAHLLHPSGGLEHREWLNLHDEIRIWEFIRQLRTALEGAGSVLVYTNYENQILEQAMHYLRRFGRESR